MKTEIINRELYEAICRFEGNPEAQEFYYKAMDAKTGKISADGSEETVGEQILRVYAALFCDDLDFPAGTPAGFDEVDATADRLYVGRVGFDPEHWYRMRHHFPVIDEDNYVRFAALVISDLKAGDLHRSMLDGGEMLIVGEADPLLMSSEERKHQKTFTVELPKEGESE